MPCGHRVDSQSSHFGRQVHSYRTKPAAFYELQIARHGAFSQLVFADSAIPRVVVNLTTRECLKLSRQGINEMSGVSGKALTMELSGIPEVHKQADGTTECMNTTGETARASGGSQIQGDDKPSLALMVQVIGTYVPFMCRFSGKFTILRPT